MTLESLLAEQEAISAQFNAQQKIVAQKRSELTDAEDELKRLQGEYRALERLKQQLPPLPEAIEPATTIKATPQGANGAKRTSK